MRSKERALMVVFVLFLTVTVNYAQMLPAPQPQFRNFSQKEGLPSSECYFVYQDRQGAVWCCTDRGVSRYDGYRFQNYTVDNGLTDNVVFRVYEDNSGRIWFITMNSMLSYYSKGTIVAYQGNAAIKKLIGTQRIITKELYEDENGQFVYSLKGLGTLKLDAAGKVNASSFGNGPDIAEVVRSKGETYVHMQLQKISMATSRGNFDLYSGKKKKGGAFLGRIPSGLDFRVTGDPAQPIVMSSRQLYYTQQGKIKVLKMDFPVIYIRQSGSDLWVGQVNGGITRFEVIPGKEPQRKETYLQGYSVTSVCFGKQGEKWFSCLEEGIFYTPDLEIKSWLNDDQLQVNGLVQVNGFRDNVYVLNTAGKFVQLNSPWQRSHVRVSLSKYSIVQFNGHLLLPGIYRPEWGIPEKLASAIWSSKAHCNIEDGLLIFVPQQQIWKVSNDGTIDVLYEYDVNLGPAPMYVQCIIRDDDGRIFVGSDVGLYMLSGSKLVPVKNDPIYGKSVTGMVRHPQWGIVVATKNDGLYIFGKNKALQRITKYTGLTSNSLNYLKLDDHNRLWVASHSGVDIVSNINGSWKFNNLSIYEGLPSNEVSGIYSYDGTIWLTTKRGVSILRSAAFPSIKKQGTLYLDYLETSDKKVIGGMGMPEFRAEEKFIRFVFGTTDFRSSEGHLFRYRVHPGAEWIYTEQPEIFLNEPVSGNYQLELSYRYRGSRWSQPVRLANFSIPEVFYRTTWFILLLIALFLCGVYFLFRLRVRQLSRRHSLNATISDLEQRALAAQMNPHFIFNALNSIQSFLVYEENEKAERYLLKFSSLIRQTLSNSREKYIRIEQELSILSDYLELESMRFSQKFTFDIRCMLTTGERQFFIPPMLVQPYVENAVIHGMASLTEGGRIVVVFERISATELKISIDDNGNNGKSAKRQKKPMHRSFGTTITQERLRFLRLNSGSNFSVEVINKSEAGTGTGILIELRLPVLENYETTDSNNR